MNSILPDVDAERAPVFPAGLAILLEVVENFGIDRVRVAEGAMREGLLYDLMGRFTNEDARVRSVRAMEKRYHVDELQADRVEATAVALLEQVESEWGLEDPLAESVLRWAARLHETGPRHRALQVSPPQRLPAASTPTCRDSRARNSCCCRPWSAVIAANCRSSRSRICCRPGIGSRSF